MVGPIAEFVKEIKEKILSLVPTTYCSDTFLSADRMSFEGQEASIPVAFRHFDISITDDAPGAFSGSYSYQHKDIALQISVLYSKSGATRVLGNADIDFEAFISNDINDIEKALMRPITTTDGSTGRLLRQGSMIQQVDNVIVGVIQYTLAAFLRGSVKVPDLYIGPAQKHTLNGGDKVYLVCQSDLAVDVAVTSAPAGLQHVATLHLASDTPTLLELTAEAAGTYTVTISGASGTASASVQVFPASDYVIVGPDQDVPNDIWSLNLAVAAASDGVLDVSGSANLTLPETVEIVNNKGVIPVTITARGSHSVSVGGDTCNFTSVTPGPYVPNFANHRTSYEAAGQYDKNRSGGIARGPNPYCLAGRDSDKVGDIKYFNVALRFCFDQSGFNSWHNIISVDMPSSSIATCNWAVLHNTAGLQYPYFIWRNVQNTAYYTLAPSYKLNAGVWYDVIWRYEFDTVTRLGVLKYNSNIHSPWTYNLTDLHEIGYYIDYGHDKTFSVNLCNYYYGKAKIYDVMICNNAQWTDQDVDNYINTATIDPSKYTLYWPLQKNTDLPYLIDYDRKNNVPMYIPGPHPNLTWVPKP